MRNFVTAEFRNFDEHKLVRLLKLFSAAALMVIAYAAVFSGFQIVDEFEHLHASWLVSIGEVPYRDFFEHHNPLLWYLSAPIVSFFYNKVFIFYVMRCISAGVSLLTLYYTYKIVLFFGTKANAWLALALVLGNLITVYNLYQFRPDTYMNCCFVAGLYYWFCYLKTNELKKLTVSFLLFLISALFLQKISLILIVTEAIMLILVCQKKMRIKDISLAALPALGVMFLFLGALYFYGILFQYIQLNLNFNQALVYYFERGAFWYRDLWFSLYGLALIAAVYFFSHKNIFFKIIAALYVAEFLMRGFYFAPHPNYYTLLVIFSAMVLSVTATPLLEKGKPVLALIILALFLHLGQLFNTVAETSVKHNSYKHYQLADYVHKNSRPDELLMNGYDKNFNIYRKDVSYYWFGLDMLLPVMTAEYGLSEKIDINELIFKYRPKFIYLENYPDLLALRTYGENRFTQKFIPELVRKLYKKTPFEKLGELK